MGNIETGEERILLQNFRGSDRERESDVWSGKGWISERVVMLNE